MSEPSRRHLEDRELPLADGSPLRWALALPPEEPAAGPVRADAAPLVIGLHYGWRRRMPSRHARDFLRVFLEPTFAGTGAVIAAPYCPERSWHHPRSVDAVLRLLDHLLEEQPVDPERVILAGYSLGGMGTWYLGARHPDRFAAGMAVAAVPVLDRPEGEDGSGLDAFLELSGRGVVPWHEGLQRFPLTVVNSRADELMPFAAVERTVQALRSRGALLEWIPLDDPGHYDSREYVDALRPVVRRLLGDLADGSDGT